MISTLGHNYTTPIMCHHLFFSLEFCVKYVYIHVLYGICHCPTDLWQQGGLVITTGKGGLVLLIKQPMI